jgi:hypothetical protein
MATNRYAIRWRLGFSHYFGQTDAEASSANGPVNHEPYGETLRLRHSSRDSLFKNG